MNNSFDGDRKPARGHEDAGLNDHFHSEPGPDGSRGPQPSPGKSSGFDRWLVLDLLLQRWHWLVIGAAVSATGFYLLGSTVIHRKYTATAQLRRFEAPGKSEFFKTTPVSGETFAAMMRAPELIKAVGDQAHPPIAPELLNRRIKIDPEADSDMVKIQFAATDPNEAVNVINLYAQKAVEMIHDLDAKQASILANEYLKKEVAQMEERIKELQGQFGNLPPSGLDTNRLAQLGGQVGALGTNLNTSASTSLFSFSQQAQRLQTAMGELNELLSKYTEAHPAVQAKRDYINDLEKQIRSAPTNAQAAPLVAMPAAGPRDGATREMDLMAIKVRAIEDAKVKLAERQSEAELYATNPPASVELYAPATLKSTRGNMRRVKVGVATIFGGMLGLGASFILMLLVEVVDNRIKTAEDVRRVTGLPVLTTLGNLRDMNPDERASWAFRSWTMLQGRLSPSANHGLVCGITSSGPGEGRSTWISLLAEAASLTGFRVLTIATRPSSSHFDSAGELEEEFAAAAQKQEPAPVEAPGSAITTSVLSKPGQVTEQLTGPNSQPMVHIPLPGWVWNLDRRKQWREALVQWREIDNLVILVELPPACVPEAVLLGSNLPNMIWLANSGTAHAGETRTQLETLRNARCHLVGAVLNRVQRTSLRSRFPRWMTAFALFGALFINAAAQQATNAPAEQPTIPPGPQSATQPGDAAEADSPAQGSFSIVSPSQRAAWQQHFTLGPGDVLTLNLYGQPELTRTEVAIGPDGRISYLEAQDIPAAGLTIDELRTKLDEALAKYRRAPRTMITPITFKSKKYYMLGKVATKGVYVLDQPLTLLEAIARAHGFESVLVDRNVYDLVDLQRSFIARGGQKLKVNFERLFQQGDLSQNVAVEPGDYIYFSAADVAQVYVVGEVRLPGPVSYYSGLTVVQAITQRAGYSERAYKARVLVIRGSLNNPQKFVVDTHAVLDAVGNDFQLKPGDIIFVNSRPFIKVEEAADLAATAFIQSIVASWVGVDVVKPVQ